MGLTDTLVPNPVCSPPRRRGFNWVMSCPVESPISVDREGGQRKSTSQLSKTPSRLSALVWLLWITHHSLLSASLPFYGKLRWPIEYLAQALNPVATPSTIWLTGKGASVKKETRRQKRRARVREHYFTSEQDKSNPERKYLYRDK